MRSILATRCSARQARDNILLTSHFLLPTLEAEHLCDEVPDLPWFYRQREALDLEASVYAFIALVILNSSRALNHYGRTHSRFCVLPT